MKKIVNWWKKLSEDNKVITAGIFINTAILIVYIFLMLQDLSLVHSARKSAKAADSLVTLQNKQFQIQNSPNLAIETGDFYKRFTGGILTYKYFIINLGKAPIHLYRTKQWFGFDAMPVASVLNIMDSIPFSEVNAYIAANPFPYEDTISKNLTEKEKYNIEYSGLNTFCTEFEFHNESSGKWRRFILIVSLKVGPQNRIWKVLYNENVDTDSTYIPPKWK